MGKRGRRRRREAALQQAKATAAGLHFMEGKAAVLLPDKTDPLLLLWISSTAPEAVREQALLYWSVEAGGQWSNRASDLGPTDITAAVCEHTYVQCLALECPKCFTAPRAQTREELPEGPLGPGTVCEACTMIPSPDSQNVLSGSSPTPLELLYFDDAPADLKTIAAQYWELRKSADSGTSDAEFPAWAHSVKNIDTTGWGPAHIAAGAAARAYLTGYSCQSCDKPLTVTSRSAVTNALVAEASCVECSPALQEKMEKLRLRGIPSPRTSADRWSTPPSTAAHRAEARWEQQQIDAIHAAFPVEYCPQTPFPVADVTTEATALALLHYAPSTTPIGALRRWAEPLDPDPDATIAPLLHKGFLRVHPDSPPAAFSWEPVSFKDAATGAGGDIDALEPPKLTDRYTPREASHYVPYGTSMGTAAKDLADYLTQRLTPAHLTQEQREETAELVKVLITGEALRYLDVQLEKRHLPPVADAHTPRLKEIVSRGSSLLALGELNNLMWRAARSAADAAQRNPQAPRANMTTFAVNCLETYVQQAHAEPERPIKPYTYDPHRLAALTRTVFYLILNTDPFTTSAAKVTDDLHSIPALPSETAGPAPAPAMDPTPSLPPESTTQPTDRPTSTGTHTAWLLDHREQWTSHEFLRHLVYLQSQTLAPRPTPQERAIAHTAANLQDLYHDFQALMKGNEQNAAIATCIAAQRLLNDPARGVPASTILDDIIDRFRPTDHDPTEQDE